MIASYGLAVYTPLGVVGVAWGTLIAQYCGLILACAILIFRYSGIKTFKYIGKGKGDWRRMLRLNSNLFIRSLCFMVVYVGFTSLAGKYGNTELAVSSIMMKLFMFFSYFVDGFAYAGEALVGKTIGEGQRDDVQSTKNLSDVVKALFNWSIGVGVVFTLIYAFWGKECIGLMTSDGDVLAASTRYLGWLIAMPIISTLAFMWDGVYVGATAGVQIRNSMIWAAVGFIAAYVVSYRFVGAQALYIAYFAHLIARVVYLSLNWKRIAIGEKN